jgi:hypothetical protein
VSRTKVSATGGGLVGLHTPTRRLQRLGWILSLSVLGVTGVLGLVNGINELTDDLTALQRSVSIGVLIYGLAGGGAAVALFARHPSSVWLATLWGVVVTYVSSTAAIAYGGSDVPLVAAIASGGATALIAAGVIWSARTSTRPGYSTRAFMLIAALVSTEIIGGCRQLYMGPPAVPTRSGDSLVTKVVRAKREPDRLIAEDLSVCWVLPEVFRGIRAGDHWRCDWRYIPEGQ